MTELTNKSINLADKLSQLHEHWSPKVIAELNDYQFKVVKVLGEFVWHSHPDTDEAFLVLAGELIIRLREAEVILKPGELYVVPKGVEHQPFASEEVQMVLIEPRGVVNTGDAGKTELTATTDDWI